MTYIPLLFFGTTLNSEARVGPNQHSAVRYSPRRHRAAMAGSSARMKAAHRGAANKLPEHEQIMQGNMSQTDK